MAIGQRRRSHVNSRARASGFGCVNADESDQVLHQLTLDQSTSRNRLTSARSQALYIVSGSNTPNHVCGESVNTSGGGDVLTRCPLARPFGGSPPTLAGALPPECIFGSRRTFSLYGCFSALRLHVSQLRPGLYCMFVSSRLCCLRVVCINMNEQRSAQHRKHTRQTIPQHDPAAPTHDNSA